MSSPEADLWSITYTSAAVRLPSEVELRRLTEQAQARNAKEQITGVLLYCNGSFLQCLEGPKAGLQRVYASICADPRHRQISELVREPVASRDYPGWSMVSCHIGGDLRSNREQLLIARLAAADASASASRRLASAFWAGGMGVKYGRTLA
jgi:hypothetical protein